VNTEFFIAQKIHQGKNEDKKVSRPIIRIAMISITLAVIINLITIAVVTGFQNQVRDKVIGFGSHATIIKAGEHSTYESLPIIRNTDLTLKLKQLKSVGHLQEFAFKPALLQSTPDTVFYHLQGIDTFQIQQQINGVIIKGVGNDFQWDFFQKHLQQGNLLDLSSEHPSNGLLVSSRIARDLNLHVGDEVNTFFIKQQPIRDKYVVTGIFHTGLEEFDKEIVLGDIRNVQLMNDWGVQATLRVADTMTYDNSFIIEANVRGGNGNYRYDWGEGYEPTRRIRWCGNNDTLIRLIASDYWSFMNDSEPDNALPDTAYLKISVTGPPTPSCTPLKREGKYILRDYIDEEGMKFSVQLTNTKTVTFEYIDGKGSHTHYIGGLEVLVTDWNALDQITSEIRQTIYQHAETNLQEFRVRSIKDDQQDIFLWLSFLNLNVIAILVLMIAVSTINMISGLFVLIITKTNLIGVLKAIGATNWSVRKIFLYQAILIILKGMIYGNIIGLGLLYLQLYLNIIPLNPEVYYLNTVPVEINYLHVLLLNIGTLVVCTLVLVLPSYVITKISPVKAIRFD
jgi:lipoprotein-releasing system permease protein